jgi:alpha-ketoglutarate-dependent taurine dioxygenase
MTPADVFHRIGTFFGSKNPFEERGALFGNDNPPEVDKVQTAIRGSGVSLIRGVVATPQAFVAFTNRIGTDFGVHHKIKSGGRLPVLEDDATVCTVETGNTALPWHREKAYLPHPPELLHFWCQKSVPDCGMTGLCDGEDIYQGLPKKAREYFDHFKPAFGTTWSREACLKFLGVATVEEAEVLLRDESSRLQPGTELDYDLALDGFRFSYRCPSIETSKWSGNPAFANYVLAQDPEDADPNMLRMAHKAANRSGFFHRWQAGDLIIVDNTRFMHCRSGFESYRSQDRIVLFRMSAAEF